VKNRAKRSNDINTDKIDPAQNPTIGGTYEDNSMTQHIFISHCSKNIDVVKKLREILELEGFSHGIQRT